MRLPDVRRRALLVTLPLLALGACGPDEQPPPTPTAAPPPPDLHPEPVLVGERAEVVPYTDVNLPLEMTPMIVVDPGWTSAPVELDGIFLAHREEEDRLQLLAVAQDGTVLWQAERPLDCTDVVLTRGAEDVPIAVLPDHAADGTRTLSAYDLRTAEQLWGPVEAPGPQVALGMVCASADGGPRTLLAGDTGLPRLVETDLAGGRILGEHLGSVLRTDGEELVALGTDGTELWRAPLPAGVEAAETEILGAVDPHTSFAAIGDRSAAGEGGTAGAVLDLSDGRVIAEDARAVAHDHVLDVTVVAAGTVVRGLDDAGAEQWRHEDPEALVLISAGERLAYAVRQQEGTLVVLDTGQGQMVQPFDVDDTGPLAMPEVFSAETAAAVRVEERRLLVTAEFDPEYGRR